MVDNVFATAGAAGIIVLFAVTLHRILQKSRLPYPPGPKPHLLWGNLRDMPSEYDYLTFREWSKKYGAVMHLSVPGKSIIILSKIEAAVDLLEKRSAIYSDRPKLTMLREIIGWDWSLAMMNYGPRFKAHRKMIQRGLNTDTEHFMMIQEDESQHLVRNLLRDPQNFMNLAELWGRSIISRTIYGYDLRDSNDPYLRIPRECERIVARTGKPGAYLVDVFPILKHVPMWFPLAGFKREVQPWRALVEELLKSPFRLVTQKIDAGNANRCYVSNLLQKDLQEKECVVIQETAASVHVAGPTSMYSTLQAFILVMTLYPDVQRKARAEIDSLLGLERMPVLSDRPRLPYVDCVVSEMLRWTRSIPLGIAHVLTQDDIYNGMFIPSDSIVMANFWAFSRDEQLYENPEQFLPERFLVKDTRDPRDFAFGFGRRVCPGKAFADAALFLAFASILSVLDISKTTTEDGKELVPDIEYSVGLVCNPKPFQCTISARSARALELIEECIPGT